MTNKNKAKNSKIKNSRSNSKDTIRRILQHIRPCLLYTSTLDYLKDKK